jgi:hypothetical protein
MRVETKMAQPRPTRITHGLPDLRGARSGPPVRVIVRGSVLSASSPRVSLWPASGPR